MGLNPSVTDLDFSQVIQREFDVANDAQRVNIVTGTVTATNPSVGTNGTTAPASSTQVAGTNGSGNLTPISVDASGNQNVNVLNALVPTAYNEVDLTYVPSGNGTGQIGTATFKLASATVATLTLSYDGSNRLTTVVKS